MTGQNLNSEHDYNTPFWSYLQIHLPHDTTQYGPLTATLKKHINTTLTDTPNKNNNKIRKWEMSDIY